VQKCYNKGVMSNSRGKKIVSSVLFAGIACGMFTISALALAKSDSYHARVLFFYSDVRERQEGVILAQKRQVSLEAELELYLFALLSAPLDGNMRANLEGMASLHSLYLLDEKSVVAISYSGTRPLAELAPDLKLIEYALSVNFPSIKPFEIIFS
jgi:hypothetical protein